MRRICYLDSPYEVEYTQVMTNYTNLDTCASTGSTCAYQLPTIDGRVRVEPQDIDFCLGGNTGWAQRRAFEWGYLGAIAHRNGEEAESIYCAERIAKLKLDYGY